MINYKKQVEKHPNKKPPIDKKEKNCIEYKIQKRKITVNGKKVNFPVKVCNPGKVIDTRVSYPKNYIQPYYTNHRE